MRKLLALIDLLIAAAIVAALAVFAAQNTAIMPFHFVSLNFSDMIWHISIASAVLGFILALLLLMPGAVVSGWRARRLNREHGQLRGDMEGLRATANRLQAERDTAVTQRDAALAERDAAARRAAAPAASSAQLAPTVPAPVVTTPAGRTAATGDPLVPPAVPVASTASMATERVASGDGATSTPSLDNTASGNPGDRSGITAAPSVPSLDNTTTGSPGGAMPAGEPVGAGSQASDREMLAPWLR